MWSTPIAVLLLRRAVWSAVLAVDGLRQPRFPFRSTAAIERAQQRRLRATIEHAYRYVPYYRQAMRRRGLVPGDFRVAADLARLPLLERGHLQRDPESFVSTRYPLDSYL